MTQRKVVGLTCFVGLTGLVVRRRSDVVNLEDHLNELSCQQELGLFAVKSLNHVFGAHV